MLLLGLALLATPGSGNAQRDSSSIDAELLQRPDVTRYIDFFTGPARDRMSQWLNRGTRYRELIDEHLEREGLPREFAYLPMIESGFSNTAVSRAGAVGMWQFMPATARDYGLRVDRWVDERRDPFRATDAAVRHIRDLNRTFGSSLVAAAAYNGGAGRLTRSLAQLRGVSLREGGSATDQDFFALAGRGMVAKETQNYVPQLLAAAIIGRDPTRFGFSVDSMAPIAVDSIRLEKPIRLAAAEQALGLDRQTLTQLNPQFLLGVTPPGGAWLRIPADAESGAAERLNGLPSASLHRLEDRPRYRLGELVRVKRGDLPGAISRRHAVGQAALRRINAIPEWYRIRAGQALRLPAS